MKLVDIQPAGAVTRYHTIHCPIQQTVAHHSWGVAMVIMALHNNPSMKLIQAALLHDAHEHVTGDVPSPAKRMDVAFRAELHRLEDSVAEKLGSYVSLDEDEFSWLNFADSYEAFLWSRMMVEDYGMNIYRNIQKAAYKTATANLAKIPESQRNKECWEVYMLPLQSAGGAGRG